MLHRGFRFEFEVPDTWDTGRDGSRLVFHGTNGEELIVSGSILEGSGSGPEAASLHDALLSSAVHAMTRTADDAELVTVKPLREDAGAVAPPLRAWTIHSQTKAGDVQFSQAAISNGMGLLLVTLEAPNVPEALSVYRALLKTVRPVKTN